MANLLILSLASPSFSSEPQASFTALSLPALPLLPAGLPRGGITEIAGARSSGRTAAMLHVLAQATARGEVCGIVDTDDQFHPQSAAAAGAKLSNLVWVRCGGHAERAMRAADLLLHAGGFGVVVLDLCEVKPQNLNRIPPSYWYRFRLAIERTETSLVVCARLPQAKASVRQLELGRITARWEGTFPFKMLEGIDVPARLRKPMIGNGEKLSLQVIA
jgi:hypothetical protein